MLSIPLLKLSIRHLNKLMRNGAVLLVHHSLLPNGISLMLRNQIYPEVVVHPTHTNAKRSPSALSQQDTPLKTEHSHRKPRNAIRRVPEAHRPAIRARLRRHPRHREQQQLDEDEQADGDVPGLELGALDAEVAALAADEVEPDGHEEEEDGFGVVLEVDDCGLAVSWCIWIERGVRCGLGHLPKLKASPAGGATIMMTVIVHLSR